MSSSESSGVNCGLRGGRLALLAGAESVEGDFWCMIPAIAAAGPARAGETGETGLGGCSGSTPLPEATGDIAGGGDFCSFLPVISM